MFNESEPTKRGWLAATNTPPSPQDDKGLAMNSGSVGGFAHAINRFFEWMGVSPAFTSYLSSLSTSAYGFLSLNEFLGIAGLGVALFTALVNRRHKNRMANLAEREFDFRVSEAKARRVANGHAPPCAKEDDPAKAG